MDSNGLICRSIYNRLFRNNLLVLLTLFAVDVRAQTTAVITTFEASAGYAVGPFTSQGAWTVTQGSASITDADKASGTQSLQLNSAASVQATVAHTSSANIVFVDLFIRPFTQTDPTVTTTATTQQLSIRFVRQADSATLYYFDEKQPSGSQWVASTFSIPVASDGTAVQWVRISAREDYATHTWDLYAGGVLIACRIGAADASQTDIGTLTVTSAAGGNTGLDDVYVGPDNPLFADVNRDGIDDAWEQKWGFSLSVDNRNGDPDGDGATNLEEYMRGTDPVTGAHSITLSNPETAGIAGFRPLWDTPVPVAENGVVEDNVLAEPGRTDYGAAPSAHWLVDYRQNGTLPGGLVFDAVHRSLLVKFPTAAQQILNEVHQGFQISGVQLVLPFRNTELWPEYYRIPTGLSFLGSTWANTLPHWHAVAEFLRRPWENDPTNGPTYNANINGVSYWTKYGAQDPTNDYFAGTYTAEVSSAQPSGTIDLTAAIANPSQLGTTLADRLDVLNNRGLLIKKAEVYDFAYWSGGYEWATETGQRGILIHTPQLVVQFTPVAIPDPSLAEPTFSLSGEITRVQQSGTGGSPTAVMPTADKFAQLSSQLGFVQPSWMPNWQWQRVQDLNGLPTVSGFTEDVAMEFPTSLSDFSTWIDSMLSIPPRRWAGFDAGKKTFVYLRDQSAFPGPVKDHWKLYWWSWLMPDRPWLNPDGSYNFVQAVTQAQQGEAYYNLTHDWKGDASLYRSYVHDLGPQDFNYWASAGVMLGGSILGSTDLVAEGRAGFENYPIRTWSWADGSTQESIDHYYFAITLGATKPFADYGPTAYDRLLGKVALTKSIEELATHYHPALRRFISTSGRTGPGYVLGIQDGLQHIIHTLSPSGALTDVGQTSVAGINVLGHDVLPGEVAALSLSGPWAPNWFSNIVDAKALPFQSKLIGSGVLKTSYLGHNYGLASGLTATGTIPFLAQWRRVEAQPSSLRDIGTLLLRYGINRTEFLDSSYHGGSSSNPNGIVGNQGGYIQPIQFKNKALVLATPTKDLTTDGQRPVPTAISSLQTSIGFYNFELSPGWQLYVDGQLVTAFPISIKNSQRITIKDGVTYIGIIPLPATNLGRTDELIISTDGVDTTLQGGGTAKEAVRIDSFNFKSATAVALTSFDPAALDSAWGGYAFEIGDETEYPSFDAFQQHIAAAQFSSALSGDGKTLAMQYTSGSDTISANFDPTGGGSVSNPMANGATLTLPAGIVRDTDVSIQGTGGALRKNGATLFTDAKAMAFLQVEPVSGTYMGVNGRPDLSKFVLEAPNGVVLRTEGKVGVFRAAVQPATNKVWIDGGGSDQDSPAGRAVIVCGLQANPTVFLDGNPVDSDQMITLSGSGGPLFIIPLNGKVDASLTQDYADTDGNGLPDAWEMKWFRQLGNSPTDDPDGDGVTNAQEFAAGSNPVIADAWIAEYLGSLDDSPYQDPGNVGRTFRQSFQQGLSPWPTATVSTGLRAWYRADMGVSVNAGYYNQLYQWTDISGSGFHMTANPGVTAPFLNGTMNGRPAVFCQGSWSQLTTSGPCDIRAGSNDLTVITVLKPDPAQSGNPTVIDFGEGGYFAYGIKGNQYNQFFLGWIGTGNTQTPPANASSERVQVISGVKNGSTAAIFLNGTMVGQNTVGPTIDFPPAQMAIGNGTNPHYGYNGLVAEILVYNRALTDSERQSIEQDLMHRYVADDSDGDGLSDAWELKYLGTLAFGASDDPGHVGRTLLQSEQNELPPWPTATVSAGLTAWYRADLGTAADTNGRVALWPDASGNGHHVAALGATVAPTLAASAMNGQPAMQFASAALQTPTAADLLSGSSDITVITVLQPDTAQSAYHKLLRMACNPDQGWWVGSGGGSPNNLFGLAWAGTNGAFQETPEVTLPANRVQVLSATKSGGAGAVYVNGTLIGSNAVDPSLANPLGALQLGDVNAKIAEIRVYNRALSDSERQQVEQELTQRYVNTDSDGDGLPDAWEQQYLGTLAYGGGDDPGQVGRTLAQSYAAGLPPWPSASITSGLRAWYRADLGVTTDSAGDVTQWSDVSGNGLHVGQLNSIGTYPKMTAGAMNGHPAIQFAGTLLNTVTPVDFHAGADDITVVAVMLPSLSQPGYHKLLRLGGDQDNGFYIGTGGGGSAATFGLSWLDSTQTRGEGTGESLVPSIRPQILSATKAGTSAALYINGTFNSGNVVDGSIWKPTAFWNIGGFNGQLAEVLVYNRALTTAERQQLEAELTQKYINPDSDHDGLPDIWEIQYLGTLSYSATDDPGHVGRTLTQSYQQGLSPWPAAPVSTGLRAWYRADLGIAKDSSNNITGWTDLSGNGIHLLQPVGVSPQWVDNTLNGHPAVAFTGNRIKTPAPVDVQGGSSDVTVIVALNPDSSQPSYRKVVRIGDDPDQGFYVGGGGGGSAPSFGAGWMNASRNQGEGAPETTLTANHPQILTVSKSGTSAILYVNGFLTTSSTVDPTMWTPSAALNLGGFNGKLGEVLIYNRALSDAERRQAELQLAQKYDDTDHDGLPDAWEMKWAGNLSTLSNPNDDPDQDGVTNIQAYLNGTSPFAGFNNFDFERQLIGWNLSAGSITAGNFTPGYTPIQHIVPGVQGQFAFMVNPTAWTYTSLTSLPFTAKAGTSVLSFQATGFDDYGLSGVAMVSAATQQVIANVVPGTVGTAWRTFSTAFTVPTDTVVYLRVYRNGSTVGGGLVFDDIKIRQLPSAFTNFDFEQGWTGWLLAGNTGQIGAAVSDGQIAPQGANAYQSALGTGTVSTNEAAQFTQLYSGLFAVHAGQNLFSAQLFGAVQSGNVDLVDSVTGTVLAELNRFDSGPVWERCYTSFYLATDTAAFIRIRDTSATSHLAVDDFHVTPYVFSNFDFEQGWAGWSLAAGSITAGNYTPPYTPIQHIVAGTQGKRAFMVNPATWTYTSLTSLPFIAPAGTSVLSFQATGSDDYGTSGIQLINSATSQVLANITPGTIGTSWRTFSTTFTVPTDTVVYLRVYRNGSTVGGGLIFDDIKIRQLPVTFTNFDFEQGWTGWLLAGNTGQIGAAVSDGQSAPQGSNAYQSAVGSGAIATSEEAQFTQLYSGLFAVHAGQNLFTGQLFGAVQTGNVDLIDSTTGAVLAELNRFDSGPVWERCYTSFYLAADTVAFIRIRDTSATSHLAVDDLHVTPYVFSNFGFEQGWAGWSLSAGSITAGNFTPGYTPIQHIVAGIEGKRAFTVNPTAWTYTNLTSLPLTAKAGTSVFSFQATGFDDYGTSGVQLINYATNQVLANITPGTIGTSWRTFSTTFTVPTDTVVYLRVYRNGSTVGGGLVFDDIKVASAVLATIPQFTSSPGNVVALAGTTVSFSAAATGFPMPMLQWTRNGIPIVGATAASLTLTNVQPADAGVYAIVATNQVGQTVSASATLTVGTTQPPTIGNQPSDQVIQFGGTASFAVQASGTAPLQYQWQHDGTNISGATAATLTITNAGLGDLGQYSVVVSNAAGTAPSSSATLSFLFAAESLSPNSVLAGSGALTIQLSGIGFTAGDTVTWNGSNRPTTFVSATQLEASIAATDIALSGSDIHDALITVRHSDGTYSNALPLTITTPNVAAITAQVAAPAAQCTATLAPASSNDAGVTATLQNNSTSSANAAVAVATYQTNATGVPYFDAGGKFVDVQVTGADPTDVVTTFFYYPAATSVPEDQLSLLYFDGTSWRPVLSSGGTSPGKNTTDNLDGTVSGGRFAVVFDETSTPKLSQLSGTVFTFGNSATIPLVPVGLRAWYRADSGVTKDPNGHVSQWADLSGNGLDLSQSVASAQPQWIASAIGTQPTLQFNNAELASAQTQLFATNDDFTVVAVTKPDVQGDTANLIWADNGWQFVQHFPMPNTLVTYWPSSNGTQQSPMMMWPAGEAQLVTIVKTGDTVTLFNNGIQQQAQSGLSPQQAVTGALHIGTRYLGQLSEVLIYRRGITDTERQQIEQQLTTKYGLADSDNDGLPDAWERQQLGTLSYGPNDDPGGVGRTLLQSYQQGLSPWPAPSVANGLRVWYRADVGVTKDANGNVSEWADVSGNGLHVTQPFASAQPKWIASAIGSQPTLQFNNSQLTSAQTQLFAANDDFTVIAVTKPDVQGDTANLMYLDNGWQFVQHFPMPNTLAAYWPSSNGTQQSPMMMWPAGQAQLVTIVKSGDTVTLFNNGVQQQRQSGLSPQQAVTGALNLGQRYLGQLSEVLIYRRGITDTERQQIEQQLTTKYGLADSDNDGLPDAWERQQLGTLSYGPNDDPGGVGRTLLQSYQQGLSPWPAPAVANGLRVWYRADVGVTKDANGNVSEWADVSGNGLHVTQPFASAQPKWIASAIGSQPTLQFNNSQLTSAQTQLFAANDDFTVIAVTKPDVQGDTANLMYVDNGWQFVQHFPMPNTLVAYWPSTNGTQQSPMMMWPAGQAQLVTIVKSGDTVTLFNNGVQQQRQSGLSPQQAVTGALNLGQRYLGQLSEVLIYRRGITDPERQQTEQQLVAKYGIAIVPGGLRAWFRADAQIVQDSNGKIAQWLDLSGHGINVAQSDPSHRPTVVTNPSTGHMAAVFDGNSFLQTTAAMDLAGGSTDFTTLAVIQVSANQLANDPSIFDADFHSGNGYHLHMDSASRQVATTWVSTAGWWGSAGITVLPDTPQLVEIVKNGTSMKCYLGGRLLWSTTAEAVMGTNPTAFALGSECGGVRPLSGQISEVLLYNRALTDAERQQIETAWINQYSLADTDHDGLPDAWELQYLGTLSYGPNDDPFNSGRTLQQSYTANLSPLPSAIVSSGLRAWYRPDIGVTKDNDGKIAQWLDLSGRGLNVTQSDPTRRPTVINNTSTGHLAANFDGNSFVQTTAAMDLAGGSTDFTTLAVIQVAANQPASDPSIFDADFHSGNGYHLHMDPVSHQVATTWVSTAGWWGSAGITVLPDTPQLVEIVKNGTSMKCYLGGRLLWSTTVEAVMGTNPTAFALGSECGGVRGLNGQISEVLLYNRALTDAERQQIETSWINQYSLADTDHDGLPDAWEMQYLGTLSYGPNDDPFNSGRTLQQSYTGNLSPLPSPIVSSGLRAWYRPDIGVTKDTSGKIAQWLDLSGHGLNVAQSDAARRPTVVNNSSTGHLAANFDGNSFVQTTAAMDLAGGSTDFTTLAVIQVAANQPANDPSIFDADFHSGNGYHLHMDPVSRQVTTTWVSTAGWWGSAGITVLPDTPQLVEIVKNGTSMKCYLGGRLLWSTTVEAVMGTNPTAFALGSECGGVRGLNGQISEVLLYNRALTDAERQQIETSWINQYSLADTDHDGLPDAWEMQYLGTLSYGPNDDPFNSGRTLQQSYTANLSPLPSAIVSSGLRAWYRPDIGVTKDNDGKIAQWLDLSGHGLNVTQSDPTRRPSVINNTNTGHLAANFDGNSFVQTTAAMDLAGGSTDFTTLAVIQVAANQLTSDPSIFDTDFHTGNGYHLHMDPASHQVMAGWVSTAGWWGSAGITVLPDTPQLVEIVKNGGTVNCYLNGQLIQTTSVPSQIGIDSTAFTIGSERDGARAVNGQLSELLVYNRALADTERQNVEAMLQKRYLVNISAISPNSAIAGGNAITVTITGAGFDSGCAALWNGMEHPTTFVSPSTVTTTISSSDLSVTALTTALLVVRNSNGTTTNAVPFVITPANVSSTAANVSMLDTVATVTTAPQVTGDAGVTTTLINNTAQFSPLTVTAANYTGNPTAQPVFEVGTKYVDVQITGAHASDQAVSYFYYPTTIQGQAEADLVLLYFDGNYWVPVTSSGGTAPIKNTTDNLDGTISGGRFTVRFDNTSTPKITGLTGTMFTVGPPDTIPPVITAPADITAEAAGPGGAQVTFTASAVDNVCGVVPVNASPASGSLFPIGTTVVTLSAVDTTGNVATTKFHVTVKDTKPPVITAPANITTEATSASGAVVTFSATANDVVDGAVQVSASPSSGSTFPLGTTIVTLTATDAHQNKATASFTVTVRDTTPPVVTALSASPNSIWPANKKMASVTLAASATDAVGVTSLKIISVACNESVPSTAWQISGALTLELLADRDGNGSGRIYTITVEARDAAGNASTKTVAVTVPHDQGH